MVEYASVASTKWLSFDCSVMLFGNRLDGLVIDLFDDRLDTVASFELSQLKGLLVEQIVEIRKLSISFVKK